MTTLGRIFIFPTFRNEMIGDGNCSHTVMTLFTLIQRESDKVKTSANKWNT